MDDGLHVGAHAIDEQMHADFAGDVAAAGDFLSVQVDDHHVSRFHRTFADAGRGDQNAVVLEAHGKIAVHGGNIAVLVQHASVADDFFPIFAFRRHGYPWGR